MCDAQRLAETADRIKHMATGMGGDALVDEQAMQLLGAALVIADTPPGRDEGRKHIGAQRDLQLQQRGKWCMWHQLPAQRTHPGQPGLLVVGMKVHARQAFQQLVPGLVDDPVQRLLWVGPLQGAYQWYDMGHIAQCRQA